MKKDNLKSVPLCNLGFIRLVIIASIAVLIGLGTFLWMTPQYTNEAILASHYQIDETFLSGDRGQDNSKVLADPFAGAAQYYKDGEYGKAVEIYQAFPKHNKALYALGHTQYKSQKYDQAILAFKKLVAKNSIEYNEKAEWYLLLSYLAANQTGDEFQHLLDKIIIDGGIYSTKAQNVKDEMNSFWRES
jgi:tetratricopeptide (TPR) repeat protein